MNEPLIEFFSLVIHFIWDSFQTEEGQRLIAKGEALLNGTPPTPTAVSNVNRGVSMDTPVFGTPSALPAQPNEQVSRFQNRG